MPTGQAIDFKSLRFRRTVSGTMIAKDLFARGDQLAIVWAGGADRANYQAMYLQSGLRVSLWELHISPLPSRSPISRRRLIFNFLSGNRHTA